MTVNNEDRGKGPRFRVQHANPFASQPDNDCVAEEEA